MIRCSGCNGDYRKINEKCLVCMKRLHNYNYNTIFGLMGIPYEEAFENNTWLKHMEPLEDEYSS